MSDTIKLNFINQSQDANNSSVVIFQQNVATDFDELVVAWKVIQHCGQDDNHPFVFPLEVEGNIGDSYGNYTPKMGLSNGALYSAVYSQSGMKLIHNGSATSSKEIQVRNDLSKGLINANVYRGEKLLATKTQVSQMQKAYFEFNPSIWIGVVSGVEEGYQMNSAIVKEINTELSLLGIQSADIVMTGGGTKPFKFELANIVKA